MEQKDVIFRLIDKQKMKFYHWTTKSSREKIQAEWYLRGVRERLHGLTPSRCTYLAVNLEEAKEYGEIVLEVDYNPYKHRRENNYMPWCWQVRVYEPILLENLKVVLEQPSFEETIRETAKRSVKNLRKWCDEHPSEI